MSKLVIFDGNAIMHRAYHALPPLTTKKFEPINAVYGLVSMLLRVINDLEPTHIAFAFDRPEPTFRKKINKEYQSHRPEMDKDLSSQFEKARKTVEAFGIPVFTKKGFEADDVIGTITTQTDADEVVVVTGDRDMLQLVTAKTKLYMPGRSLADARLYGKSETIEKMGVPPSQIIDFKALVGDPSDNYKGVPGVGPVTAIHLLEKYKTLDNIYKNLDKLKERQSNLLRENKDSAYESQLLATIVLDVKTGFKLSNAEKWKLGNKKTLDLFAQYGFNTLTKRVKKMGEEMESKKQMTLV